MREMIVSAGLDLQDMISKRLLEIEDLEERKEVRNIVDNIFSELCAIDEKQYIDLEKLMDRAVQNREKKAVIYTSLLDKSRYDGNKNGMYPMFLEDVSDMPVETETLLSAIHDNKPWKLGTFFLEADYHTVQQLADKKQTFSGIIRTKNMSYKATVEVRAAARYRELLKQLYGVFIQNNMPWRTLCVPYIHKMFDYYITDTDLPWYEQIETIDIQFGQYEKWVRRNRIPVWNVEQVCILSDLRPSDDRSALSYHHVINGRRLQMDSKYLLADTNCCIINCYRDYNIHIITTEPKARKWQLYRIETKVEADFDYEICSNEQKISCTYPVRTAGGVMRLLYALGYEERFSVEKVELTDKGNNKEQVYSMNEIWNESIILSENRPTLVVKLKSKVQDYLQTDILSYLISEVENQYPEYHCIAEFV